jgi:hypothetical protein
VIKNNNKIIKTELIGGIKLKGLKLIEIIKSCTREDGYKMSSKEF